MTQPGYIIKGKGNPDSLCSASHGAGRLMSRSQALKNFDWHQLHEALQRANVELIGGDLDEAPMAYKEIDRVMALQSDLVEILAVFQPRIVRMADPDTRARRRNV
jgi:tRNA-splicing ligase RtcB